MDFSVKQDKCAVAETEAPNDMPEATTYLPVDRHLQDHFASALSEKPFCTGTNGESGQDKTTDTAWRPKKSHPPVKWDESHSNNSENPKNEYHDVVQQQEEYSPESLLQSLFGPTKMTATVAEKTQTICPAMEKHSSETLTRIVERILVSDAGAHGTEVRLSLAEGPLAGAEIMVTRSQAGLLSVAIHCVDIASFQCAVASRPDLVAMLKRNNENVRVDIEEMNGAEGGNEGDCQKRPALFREFKHEFADTKTFG